MNGKGKKLCFIYGSNEKAPADICNRGFSIPNLSLFYNRKTLRLEFVLGAQCYEVNAR